ncbi:uncharacterized protein BX664DRAFT_335111 [Halteromyces radiatus]|uniref:uncharacterized protein n=1 Tax=Halteromyces radiatus TaxID=101107 RepID=UPI002220468C|nr:uncharacterized protein BX664DRAFT_335111 [Halteromyces radiatus]KAI8086180.1 hypothetical protein BX664DRAFT_335111 [Halteromyces radiatus]
MFVPTIKYKKVNETVKNTTSECNIKAVNSNNGNSLTTQCEPIKPVDKTMEKEISLTTQLRTAQQDIVLEEKDEAKIIVDPSDEERILITLSDGKTQYTADRYCPHAGADLSYLGQVEEDEYPVEIGPVLICTLHYWEYALNRKGRGANGVATINACPVGDGLTCQGKKELEW